MDISLHQPQYLPWISYFTKIEQSDLFIFLDSVDFQKNGLQNRNQIKTKQGREWLTVPVQQRLGQKINEVEIVRGSQWRRKHWEKIQHGYRKTNSFKTFEKEISLIFSHEWLELSKLNIYCIELMLELLEIDTPILKSSQMKASGQSSDLVLNLCKEVGASRYISGIGGKDYLKEGDFEDAGIEIIYQAPILPEVYPQPFPEVEFLSDLSVIDILFNCGATWRDHIPRKVG
jgi:hypothetical protein